jgi:hypothetical protein
VELYTNFRPFVPRQYWDETCPTPGNEVLTCIKDEITKKQITKADTTPSITKKAAAAAAAASSENTPGKRAAPKEKSALKQPARKKTKAAPVQGTKKSQENVSDSNWAY